MAGRLTTTSSYIMEDREALKREAARERQERGAMSGVLSGKTSQCRSNRTSVLQPHSAPTSGLFGAPVRVEQEDETSRMIKHVLGDYQALSRIIQGSSLPISQGHSSHFGATQPAQHAQQVQPTRRPQQTGPPPVESRQPPRQPNGVSSPHRGLHPHNNPKQVATSQAPNYSKPPLMTAAARKSHTAEPVACTKPQAQDLIKKGGASGFNSVVPKPSNNSSGNSNNNNNNNNNSSSSNSAGGNSRLPPTPDLSRLEEVLKEMRLPPLLPNFDEVDKRDLRRKDDREDKHRNAAAVTTSTSKHLSPQVSDVMAGDMPSFASSLGIGGLPQLPIEPPPMALSPMRSPQGPLSLSLAPAAAVTPAVSTALNQRLQPPAAPPQGGPMGAPGIATASGSMNKKPFELPRVHAPLTCLSSASSSESDDDDDHESPSQEESQDSDVEQKSVRMNATFDKSFASTERFPEKSNQFGDGGGVPSLFPQQRVPQLQVQPPNSAEAQSIESPLSASDDTNAEESKASWSLAAFMPGATPSSVASSVKSPAKSSPRRSPTPNDATPNKSARESRNEYRNRKRGLSGSEHSKESSNEPTSSAEKRRPAPVGRHTRSSVTPDSEAPAKAPAGRKLNATRVSPLTQIQLEGSNGLSSDEQKRRKAAADDESSLVVRIPLALLKRRPMPVSKCDNSSTQAGHNDVKPRMDRTESAMKLNVEDSSREIKDALLSRNNNGDERRDDSPMSIESISSSSSSKRRHPSPDAFPQDKSKRPRSEAPPSSSSTRKRVTEKRDRSKADIEATTRRDSKDAPNNVNSSGSSSSNNNNNNNNNSSNSNSNSNNNNNINSSSSSSSSNNINSTNSGGKKDEKRKPTSDAEQRVREDRRRVAGPSTASAVADNSLRLKEERKDVKSEARDEALKPEREPFALYKEFLANNRFAWGMTLSDAAERAAREQKSTKYDIFIEEAKALKHSGDTEATNATKAKKYLQSAACFLLGGNLMELARPESSTAVKMYQETLLLVKHAFNQGLQKAPPGGSQESRLAVLCLKVQAFLSYRVYFALNRDKDLKERLLSSQQEFMRISTANTTKQTSNEQSTPNGTTVSPAGSQSSASSGMHNSRDNGVRQDAVTSTQPKQISLSVDLVANLQKFHFRNLYLTRAMDLWAQAEALTVESNNQEFFQAVESGSAPAGLTMPTVAFVLYVREAIYRIDKFSGAL